MIDKQKITLDYENLRKVQYTELLPLEKVLELEQAKEDIISGYLSKIVKINEENDKYTLDTNNTFNLSDLLDEFTKTFGNINFIEKNNYNGHLSIDIACQYGMIGLSYQGNTFKYSVTVFWDI